MPKFFATLQIYMTYNSETTPAEGKRARFLLVVIILLFVIRMPFFPLGQNNHSFMILAELISVAGYLLFFPVMASLPGPSWTKAAGYMWIILDSTASTLPLYGVSAEISTALRFGGAHLALAVWMVSTSYYSRRKALMFTSFPVAFFLIVYSFINTWVPQTAFIAFYPILLIWFFLLRGLLTGKNK